MDQEYDLAQLAEDLGKEIPEITELYLFGSRARGTKSTRSDADVLVISSAYIQPQVLREYSSEHCEALDLFVVDGGKATSSQNESFIEAVDFPALLERLGAVKIWSRESGREAANIQWRFTVKEGVEFSPSVLPSSSLTKEKTDNQPIDPSKLTLGQLFSSLTMPQLVAVGVVLIAIIGTSFGAGVKYAELSSKDTKSAQQAAPADAPKARAAEQ
ncbi:MAG: nucleotidyltransferase domain-containing protein [Candidatus Thiodiazotropha sp.]